jgi:hypothetical protein
MRVTRTLLRPLASACAAGRQRLTPMALGEWDEKPFSNSRRSPP